MKQAQLDLLRSIADGLSRGADEMLRVSPTDAVHPPSCSLAIRDAADEIERLRPRIEYLTQAHRAAAECAELHRDDNRMLRAQVERLRADLATQQGCCDGAAAQDAHVRREREEHRAEVERLREELALMKAGFEVAWTSMGSKP